MTTTGTTQVLPTIAQAVTAAKSDPMFPTSLTFILSQGDGFTWKTLPLGSSLATLPVNNIVGFFKQGVAQTTIDVGGKALELDTSQLP